MGLRMVRSDHQPFSRLADTDDARLAKFADNANTTGRHLDSILLSQLRDWSSSYIERHGFFIIFSETFAAS